VSSVVFFRRTGRLQGWVLIEGIKFRHGKELSANHGLKGGHAFLDSIPQAELSVTQDFKSGLAAIRKSYGSQGMFIQKFKTRQGKISGAVKLGRSLKGGIVGCFGGGY